ncbi:type IV pilus modification PilV family protein [Adhaeretor mobilis]|uniref:Uncharacterized protein n=1 Tax=Adhaeretor mobilis TaxID=1930276 RepID=A0A517MTA7_9BACT|nr:prepilin-type N-terminal cleavage/methylation domain-containing protein [Adhaeretor mobilis]QDS98027.1 hypothetical protein HG15A2_12970 [Adhaeretor mobilis]
MRAFKRPTIGLATRTTTTEGLSKAEGGRRKAESLRASLQQAPPSPFLLPPSRRGISLLEVLISMFVLLFGLMGVASLFPVGNFYASRGERASRGVALSDAAFDEMLARGMLKPEAWLYGDPDMATVTELNSESISPTDKSYVIHPETVFDGTARVPNPQRANIGEFNLTAGAIGPGRAFVIDPIGVAAALPPQDPENHNQFFPYAGGVKLTATMPAAWKNSLAPILEDAWPIRRVTLPAPDPTTNGGAIALPLNVADTIFSLHDTLSVELPEESDKPAIQRWRTADVDLSGSANNTPDDPSDDQLLRRQYDTTYTWLATVVPVTNDGLDALQPAHDQYGNRRYDVSVAVFYRREEVPSETSERLLEAVLLPGGELELIGVDQQSLEDATEDIRTGQWIALAGVNQTNGTFLMKWYRLLSLDDETSIDSHGHIVRRAMLDGPAWPQDPANPNEVEDLRAILLPGVVSVTTRSIPMQQN